MRTNRDFNFGFKTMPGCLSTSRVPKESRAYRGVSRCEGEYKWPYRMGSRMVIGKQGVNWVSKGQLARHAYLVLTENVFLIFRAWYRIMFYMRTMQGAW